MAATPNQPSAADEVVSSLRANLTSVIQGKEESVDLVVIALLAGGSILMEDVPGVGKTTLAKALAHSIDAVFRRIQFTPDLLPADILGASIYNASNGSFQFREGPVFCNVLLADEINRASPRTQSALLEAMSEMQATIEGERRALPAPFLVIATQNPVEFHGTYPLPEAQLDRFLLQLDLGYPDPDTELKILHSQAEHHPLESLRTVINREKVLELQQAVRRVHVDESIGRYIVSILGKTRSEPALKLGVSPRGGLMLFRAAQAAAFTQGRDHVLPDDVQRLAAPVLAHRLMLTSKAKYSGATKRSVLIGLIEATRVPV